MRSWPHRAAVVDRSMEPGLLPGDWILVDPRVPRLNLGDVVVAEHPDHAGESIVKRLVKLTDDRAALAPDATRGRAYDVPRSLVTGVAWLRYWPVRRAGRVR